MLADINIPTPLFLLSRRRDYKIEAMRQFLKYNGWARKKNTFSAYFRTHILSDTDPPYLPFRHKRRLMNSGIKRFFLFIPFIKIFFHRFLFSCGHSKKV